MMLCPPQFYGTGQGKSTDVYLPSYAHCLGGGEVWHQYLFTYADVRNIYMAVTWLFVL